MAGTEADGIAGRHTHEVCSARGQVAAVDIQAHQNLSENLLRGVHTYVSVCQKIVKKLRSEEQVITNEVITQYEKEKRKTHVFCVRVEYVGREENRLSVDKEKKHRGSIPVSILHAGGGAVVTAVCSFGGHHKLGHVADDARAEESDAVFVAGAWRLDRLTRHTNLRKRNSTSQG